MEDFRKTFRFREFQVYRVSGFTLIELLLVLAIFAVLSTVSILFLTGYRSRNTLTIEAKKIATQIREVQNRAVVQQDSDQWGIRFQNPSAAADSYVFFRGASFSGATASTTVGLNSRIKFLDPGEGANKEIVFAKITGLPNTATSVIISLTTDNSASTTISIDSQGVVNY